MRIDLAVLTGCHIIIQCITNRNAAVQRHSLLQTILENTDNHFHIFLRARLVLYDGSKCDSLLHAHPALFDIRLIRGNRFLKLIQKGFRYLLGCRILMEAVGFRIQISLELHLVLRIQNIPA